MRCEGGCATSHCLCVASFFDVPLATGRPYRRRELETPPEEGYPAVLPAAPPRDICAPPLLSSYYRYTTQALPSFIDTIQPPVNSSQLELTELTVNS